MQSLSVFFPAFNEEKNIKEMVEDTLTYLETTGRDFEVIVVNDHSADATDQVVKENFANDPRVRLVENSMNPISGYGGALRQGFASATKDLIFFTDSDRQFDIKELDNFLSIIDSYDYVIGYRINRQDPLHRNLNAWAYSLLVKTMLGVFVKDIDCAYKLFKKEVIDSIEIKSNSALINAEILYKLKQKHFSFTQIGVHHYPRKFGKPTGANIKVILRMFKDLFKLKMNML